MKCQHGKKKRRCDKKCVDSRRPLWSSSHRSVYSASEAVTQPVSLSSPLLMSLVPPPPPPSLPAQSPSPVAFDCSPLSLRPSGGGRWLYSCHNEKKKKKKKWRKSFVFLSLVLLAFAFRGLSCGEDFAYAVICTPLPSVVAGILTTYWARAVESCKERVMLILIYRYTISTCHEFLHNKSQTSSIYREVISASGIYSEGFSFLIKKRLRQNG